MSHEPTESAMLSAHQGIQWLLNSEGIDLDIVDAEQSSLPDVIQIPFFGSKEHDGTFRGPVEESRKPKKKPLSGIQEVAFSGSRSDLTEDPAEWIDFPDLPTDPRQLASPKTDSPPIERLVDLILNRFPLDGPTSILFTGSEDNAHVDETCALVAESLARRNVGEILLVDSNQSGSLSKRNQLDGEPGVCQLLMETHPWEETVICETTAGLDFLPFGKGQFHRWGGADRLRLMMAQMKQRYQFVCVSAGDAHGEIAGVWSGVCDGSYLLVSQTNSCGAIAQSAVAELQSCGARLLGCVVTDATEIQG